MINKIASDGSSVALDLIFIKEGERFIATAPALELSAQGDSMEEAQKAFDEIFQIFIDDVVERGTLDNLLESLGWQYSESKWKPPIVVNRISQTFQIPAHA